ncbi:MAG: Gfo/Idh/MocA family oxidoreductase, partial [Pirellulales bacterium]|nr:Gfo/Idh/MocA family oxidoreductase [Pirellulales bacterium]
MMATDNAVSRRMFLKASAATAAAGVFTGTLRAQDPVSSANDRITVAVIGLKGRGQSHIQEFAPNLVALCDCDESVLAECAAEFKKKFGRKVDTYVDYRELIQRDDIDAVSIATPNHTHALIGIAAIQAGKHVYCEKPVSHNVWEGRQFANAAKKYNRIVQCGTQSRSSDGIRAAVEWVQNGGLGAIRYALGTCYKPRQSISKLDKPLEIPKTIHYDLWCGSAEERELYRPKLHYDWHWDFNTGCGDMGNQGIHQMDIARWFLGHELLSPRVISIGGRLGYEDAGDTPNTQVVLHDYPGAPILFETRGLPKSKAAQKNWG